MWSIQHPGLWSISRSKKWSNPVPQELAHEGADESNLVAKVESYESSRLAVAEQRLEKLGIKLLPPDGTCSDVSFD